MTKVRFKYTKNHTYRCTRCNTEYEDMPVYCQKCARELISAATDTQELSPEYLDLFSPSERGY